MIERHETIDEKQERRRRESSVRPRKRISVQAPARLKGHEGAARAWRRIMRLYAELEGEIVTRLDTDLLVDYCLLMEQLEEMDCIRQAAGEVWKLLEAKRQELMAQGDIENAIIVGAKALSAFEGMVKLDGRVDRKRDLLHKWRQSLYLTPRARAGVAPKEKEPEEAPDELERLLDDVVNL